MQSVSLSRHIEADPDALRERIEDVGPFMRAAGFDDVSVDGDQIRLANAVGLLFEIELTLEIVERDDAVLAYEQRDGIFDTMTTTYEVEERGDGAVVRAKTEFALDVSYAGPVFDATVVKRQRRSELSDQLDYLASAER